MRNDYSPQDLLEQAIALAEQNKQEEAVSLYLKAITAAPEWATPHYNLELYYKYEGNWQLSYQHNKKAVVTCSKVCAVWESVGSH